MAESLFIPVLLGTNRQGRQSEQVANLIIAEMKKRKGLTTELFDVRNFDLPHDGYGQALKDRFPEYRDAIIRADGLVIVTPEYNHGYPGVLKSVLDLCLKEYVHKAVGFAGVSSGPWGGTRVIENMLPMVRELGLTAVRPSLNFPTVQNTFDADGKLLDEKYLERIGEFLNELVWMSRALKWSRENLS